MIKIYIGNNKVLKNFLESKYGFLNYPINVNEKNNISSLRNLRKGSLNNDKILVVSDGLPAYYSYYSSNFFDVTILLNPKFFLKNGYMIKPTSGLISTTKKNNNKFILLSNNNPNLNKIKKYMDSIDEKYIVSDSVVKKMVKIFDDFI